MWSRALEVISPTVLFGWQISCPSARSRTGGQSAQPEALQSQSSWKPFLGTWRTRTRLGTASTRLDCTQPTWPYSRTEEGLCRQRESTGCCLLLFKQSLSLGLPWHPQLVCWDTDWVSGQHYQAQGLWSVVQSSAAGCPFSMEIIPNFTGQNLEQHDLTRPDLLWAGSGTSGEAWRSLLTQVIPWFHGTFFVCWGFLKINKNKRSATVWVCFRSCFCYPAGFSR